MANYRFSAGPAASNTYDDATQSQLTLDWSFDGVYFIYRQEPTIVLSIGEQTTTHDSALIDTPEKITVLRGLLAATNLAAQTSPFLPRIVTALKSLKALVKAA
jgi:hypothetical protein